MQSFNVLQQRLNRKSVTAKLIAEFPAHLRAYDLLADGDEDLRELPFAERRRAARRVRRAARRAARIDLSPLVPFATWDELTAARKDPAAAGAGADADAVEGIMLKRRDALYLPGRPKGPWWKWKRDPFIVDAVLMYAQRGHGKRSSYYSDYTFGVWTRGDEGDELVPVGKAYFGFTDEELLQIDRFVRRNTTDRFGPVREVVHEPDRGAGAGSRVRGAATLDPAQIRAGDAVSAHQPAALGQAAGRSRPAGAAGDHDRADRTGRTCVSRSPRAGAARRAKLRRGRMSDLDALVALEQAVFTVDHRCRGEAFAISSPRRSAALIVAEEGGKLAGYALVLYPAALAHGPALFHRGRAPFRPARRRAAASWRLRKMSAAARAPVDAA